MSLGNEFYATLFNSVLVIIVTMYITGDYFWDALRFKVGVKATRIIMSSIRGLFFSLILYHSYSTSPIQLLDLKFVVFAIVIELRGLLGGLITVGVMTMMNSIYVGISGGMENLVIFNAVVMLVLTLGDSIIRKFLNTRWRRWLIMSLYGMSTVAMSYLFMVGNGKKLGFEGINPHENYVPIVLYFFLLAPIASYLCTRITFHIYDTRQALRKLEVRAMTDDLTQIYNVRGYNFLMSQYDSKCHAYNKKLSLLVIDMDKFKKINDTYGHIVGDDILKQFASILKEHEGNECFACRKGGDEFVLIMFDTDIAKALETASIIRNQIHNTFFVTHNNERIQCDASIGVACFPDTVVDLKDLFETADKNLYQSKYKKNSSLLSITNNAR